MYGLQPDNLGWNACSCVGNEAGNSEFKAEPQAKQAVLGGDAVTYRVYDNGDMYAR